MGCLSEISQVNFDDDDKKNEQKVLRTTYSTTANTTRAFHRYFATRYVPGTRTYMTVDNIIFFYYFALFISRNSE